MPNNGLFQRFSDYPESITLLNNFYSYGISTADIF